MRHWNTPTWFALATTISLLAVGCGKQGNQNNATATTVTPAPAVLNPGAPPAEEECRAFGKKLEAAVAANDHATATRLFRLDDLFERSVSDLALPTAFRQGAMTGVKKKTGQLVGEITTEVQKGGKYTFIGYRVVAEQPRVLFRVLTADDGLNYHELTLARYPDGTVALEDLYLMLTGEMLSQTFRRIILNTAAELDHGLMAKLKSTEQVYLNNATRLQAMAAAVKGGRHNEGLATFRQLPVELQKEKMVLILALMAAQEVGEGEYLKILETYRQTFPGDSSLDLILIDYYLLKKQHDDAIQCVDRLDKAIGGDPYLHMMRANVHFDANRIADAKTSIEKCIEQDPKMENAYWLRITLALKEENHADTFAWLKKIVENCNITLEIDNIKTDENYAKFAKSPQYTDLVKWLQMRKS